MSGVSTKTSPANLRESFRLSACPFPMANVMSYSCCSKSDSATGIFETRTRHSKPRGLPT